MSNTITFTFDGVNPPNDGDTIIVETVNTLGQEIDYTWTWTDNTFRQSFEVVIVETDFSTQATKNNEQFSEAAPFDLNESLFFVTRTQFTTTITSLTGTTFITGGGGTFDGVSFEVENPEPEEPTLERIHVRSPYFISAPVYDGEIKDIKSAVFNIYIYEGVLNTSKPSTPTYTYEKKQRYSIDKNIYIDISKQVSDYIDNKYSGVLQTDCVFVEVEIISSYGTGTITDNKTFLALNGYNLHEQNVNHIPTESVLLSNSTISVLSGELIYLPFYLGNGQNFEVSVVLKDGAGYSLQVDPIDIINTNNVVRYVEITDTEIVEYINVLNLDTFEQTVIDVEIVTECIYDPVKITFVNRFGVLQDFYSYKVSKETIKSTSDSYNRSILKEDLIGGLPVLSYQPTEHRKREYNRQATKSIELNTGYIAEDNNVIIEEMLTSEYIWLTIDDVVIPANLSTKQVPLLTRINDQLIKYKLNFDFSYNEVQNIR